MIRLCGSVKLRCAEGFGVPLGVAGGVLRADRHQGPGGSRSSSRSAGGSRASACWTRLPASVAASLRLAGVRRGSCAFGAQRLGLAAQLRGAGRLGLLRQRLEGGVHLRDLLLAQPHLRLWVIGTVLGVVRRVLGLGARQPALDFGAQPRLVLDHPVVALRLVLARVGLHLRSVDRHVAELHKPG
ncbi:MAG: hypothetical protein H6708_26665 [Kofleriaceae bacterium]|nr:hypothetical protein [Kofleriaceae bacterium]